MHRESVKGFNQRILNNKRRTLPNGHDSAVVENTRSQSYLQNEVVLSKPSRFDIVYGPQ